MDIKMTQKKYESLPIREEVKHEYIVGNYYRSKHKLNTVFLRVSNNPPEFYAYPITLCYKVIHTHQQSINLASKAGT